MQALRSIDDRIDSKLLATLRAADEALELLFEAYAGAMYPQVLPLLSGAWFTCPGSKGMVLSTDHAQEDMQEDEGAAASADVRIDRAEMIHLLQDFDVMGRGVPPEGMSGVFVGMGQSLNPSEFKRCVARAGIVLAPEVGGNNGGSLQTSEAKLRWLLRQLPLRINATKLPVLDVQRRVRVLAAAEHLASLLG